MAHGPINLTAAAGRMPWGEVGQALRMRAHSGGCTLELHALDYAEGGQRNEGLLDTVYVVVSGYGVLHAGDAPIECTEGDVLFVPRGHQHRFERLDGDLRLWCVTLAADAP